MSVALIEDSVAATSLRDAAARIMIELEKVTAERCAVCEKLHYQAEMSWCPEHGYFCMNCDCACPLVFANDQERLEFFNLD